MRAPRNAKNIHMMVDGKSTQRNAGGKEEACHDAGRGKANTTPENEPFTWRKAGDTSEQNGLEVRAQGSNRIQTPEQRKTVQS